VDRSANSKANVRDRKKYNREEPAAISVTSQFFLYKKKKKKKNFLPSRRRFIYALCKGNHRLRLRASPEAQFRTTSGLRGSEALAKAAAREKEMPRGICPIISSRASLRGRDWISRGGRVRSSERARGRCSATDAQRYLHNASLFLLPHPHEQPHEKPFFFDLPLAISPVAISGCADPTFRPGGAFRISRERIRCTHWCTIAVHYLQLTVIDGPQPHTRAPRAQVARIGQSQSVARGYGRRLGGRFNNGRPRHRFLFSFRSKVPNRARLRSFLALLSIAPDGGLRTSSGSHR